MDTLRDQHLPGGPLGQRERPLAGLGLMSRGATSGRAAAVLVTGHTGFKGGWLGLWLQPSGRAGAPAMPWRRLPSPTCSPSRAWTRHVDSAHRRHPRRRRLYARSWTPARPEIVFHLAAQPLVRTGYAQPLETFATNVMGTVPCPGRDPLPAIGADCHRRDQRQVLPATTSGPGPTGRPTRSAATTPTAQQGLPGAGGGGLASRLPDAGAGSASPPRAPAMSSAAAIGPPTAWCRTSCAHASRGPSRSPCATRSALRPWQHVLDPLSGYLMLAERLCTPADAPDGTAWNFGPTARRPRPVGGIVGWLRGRTGAQGATWRSDGGDHPHEAQLPQARQQSKARAAPGLAATLGPVDAALARTVAWHQAWHRRRGYARAAPRTGSRRLRGTP